MQRMVATSAAAMAVGETGCHRGDKSGDAGTDAVAFGPPASGDGSAPVVVASPPDAGNVVVPERHHGYAVVDPMPRPAHCPTLQSYIKGTAKRAAGGIVITLTSAGGREGFKYVSSTPTVFAGRLAKNSIDGNGNALVTVVPDAGADTVIVSVRGTCGTEGPVTISATVVLPEMSVTIHQF